MATGKIQEQRGPAICSSKAAYDLLRRHAQADREILRVLYLDTKNQILEARAEFVGTVDTASVYPREIFKRALLLAASGIIISHNHPSGDPTPSSADCQITQEIKAGAEILGLKLLDHLIIGARVNGEQRYYSFGDAGLWA